MILYRPGFLGAPLVRTPGCSLKISKLCSPREHMLRDVACSENNVHVRMVIGRNIAKSPQKGGH